MGIFSLIFGGHTQSADDYAWEQYESGFESDYTADAIDDLNCSDEMKQRIEINIRGNAPGGELPTGESYHSDSYQQGNDYTSTWTY